MKDNEPSPLVIPLAPAALARILTTRQPTLVVSGKAQTKRQTSTLTARALLPALPDTGSGRLLHELVLSLLHDDTQQSESSQRSSLALSTHEEVIFPSLADGSMSDPALLLARVVALAAAAAGCASLDADTPLMDAGLDSGSIPHFAAALSRLSRSLGGPASVAATLVLETGTARGLVDRLSRLRLSRLAPSASAPTPKPQLASHPTPGLELLSSCSAARWPGDGGSGGSCGSPLGAGTTLYAAAAAAFDAITSLPCLRATLSPDASLLLGLDSRRRPCLEHGGFLQDAELFDNAFFGVAPAEAKVMDPQQRLLLESGYEALHACGLRRPQLLGSSVGV